MAQHPDRDTDTPQTQDHDVLSAPSRDALLWAPRFVADPDMMLHVPLLFWLVAAIRPARTGVAGVAEGAGVMALAQAMDKLDLGGRCMGWGVWTDPAGQVPRAIADHAAQLYTDLADITACADAATMLHGVRDASLDLLLVDLRGDPGAARDRAADWTRVLAPGGVLVLHGTRDAGIADPASGIADLLDGRRVLERDAGAGLVVAAPHDLQAPPLTAVLDASPAGFAPAATDLLLRRLGQGHAAVALQAADRPVRATLKRQIADLKEAAAEATAARDSAGAAYDASSARLIAAQTEVMDLRDRMQALQDAQARTEADLNDRIAALTDRLARADAAVAAAQADLAVARDTRFRETAVLTRQLETLGKAKPQPQPAPGQAADKAALDRLRGANQAQAAKIKALEAQVATIPGLKQENRKLQAYTQALLASTSWRVTAPIRGIKRAFGR